MADDSRDAHQAARPAGHDPNRDDQRVRDAGRRAAGHRGGAALHVQARHRRAVRGDEPRMARRCTDQGPSDQGPIDPSRQSEHPGCDIMFAWLVPLASLTVTAQRSLPRFSDGVDVSS